MEERSEVHCWIDFVCVNKRMRITCERAIIEHFSFQIFKLIQVFVVSFFYHTSLVNRIEFSYCNGIFVFLLQFLQFIFISLSEKRHRFWNCPASWSVFCLSAALKLQDIMSRLQEGAIFMRRRGIAVDCLPVQFGVNRRLMLIVYRQELFARSKRSLAHKSWCLTIFRS